MADTFTPAERSRIMAAIKSRDTKPELIVRSLVHQLGYRFRLHDRTLPGTPDIVLSRHRKIINLHGCFWHMHWCQRHRKAPVTRAAYWTAKRAGNAARDRRNLAALRRRGWDVLVLWECQTRDISKLTRRIKTFLSAPRKN
jgi:DNA mismatch endonuclease, patch repair protein